VEQAREAALARAASQFGPFDGRAWLNTAHQGPLPRPAVEASSHAAALKAAPHRIGDADFSVVPERLRALLGELVGSPAEQIVLGNSTSHGLHLIANGLPWADGDEVLVIEGDYPATVLPWQRHQQLTAAGLDTAFREGNLRLSLHLFNTVEQVDRALDILHAPPRSLMS
jgi:selenocysteine lyase/cysteine desulfurase